MYSITLLDANRTRKVYFSAKNLRQAYQVAKALKKATTDKKIGFTLMVMAKEVV